MINNKNNPVQWYLLLKELIETREHLENLIDKMSAKEEVDEIEYQLDLGHIYAHPNRAWNSRNRTFAEDEGKDDIFEAESQFPKDIRPV